jgi:phosphomannomutase
MSQDVLMLGVSGMRGTVDGSLTKDAVANIAAAFAVWLKNQIKDRPPKVLFARDSRPSGPWLRSIVSDELVNSGVELIDLDIVTTPGAAMMVRHLSADGAVVATASHNPSQWNGLKFLNAQGCAPPASQAAEIIALYNQQAKSYVDKKDQIPPQKDTQTHALHIRRILEHVDVLGISSRRYRVVLDSVNGAGCVATSTLISKLGCHLVHINGTPDGKFTHDPEPTEKNLTELAEEVTRRKAAVGFAQDPDGDRLAIVDETGRYIGEEYSLVLAARWLLSRRPGLAVANLSSSRMLDDVAAAHNSRVLRTPVGEAHVVAAMLRENAVVGGEGNGGVIDPRIVPGRDSLVGIAFILQLLSATNKSISQLVSEIPRYQIIKTKLSCAPASAPKAIAALKKEFANEKVDLQDGIRIDFHQAWLHARASNTEPIMRIIAEAPDRAKAEDCISRVRKIIDNSIV